LRGDHGGKHQSGIEGGVDDSRVKGHAGEHDARTAARIGSERKVDQVKAVESSEATSHGYRDDFDDAGANKEEQQKLPGERFHEIKLEADNGEVHGDEKREGDFSDGVQRVSKQAALLVDDCESSEKGGKDQIYIQRAGENAIGKQYGESITDGRLLGEKVVFRFVDSLYRSGQEREAEHEEGDGRDEMVSHLARVQYGGSGYGRGDGESRPQHNVLKHGHAQDQTGEARVQDFEIGKDFGNYGNGGDGDSDRKNNDQ